MESKSAEFLIELFKEAYNHYRHLENQRNQYMIFYFTLLIGSVGLITAIISKENPLDHNRYFQIGVEMVLWFNLVVSAILLAATKKNGFALKRHERIIYSTANQLLSVENRGYEDFTKPYDDKHPYYESRIISTQLAIEYVIIIISALIDITFSVLLFYFRELGNARWAMAIIFIPVFIFQVIVFLKKSDKAL
jgi:Na+-driven multidrug efflux pump